MFSVQLDSTKVVCMFTTDIAEQFSLSLFT